MTVHAHRCAHCSAPLDVAFGAEILTCRFCGTKNERERPAVQVTAAAGPRQPAPALKTFVVLGAVGAIAVTVGVAAFVGGQPSRAGSGTLGSARGPLVLTWADDKQIDVAGEPGVRIEAAVFQGTYQLTFHGFPEGTTWKVGDRNGVVKSRVYDIAKVRSVEPELGGVPVAHVKDHPVGPTSELVVETKEGRRGAVALRPVAAWATIADVLKRVENAPVRFEPDAAPRPGKTALVFVDGLTLEVLGPAETLREIDEVAVPHPLTEVKAEKVCSGYKDARGNPRPAVTYRFEETEVVVFDRRTGEARARRVFAPEVRCPMFDFLTTSGPRDSHPTFRDFQPWLATRVRRGP
jgi:hypothetical protein